MILKVLGNRKLQISFVILILGILTNAFVQSSLYHKQLSGQEFPQLHDLLLDNLPYYNLSYAYDLSCLLGLLLFLIYVVRNKKYKEIPYYLTLFGISMLLRGIFIGLTPMGNPKDYELTSPLGAFSLYDIGLYPSGHTGYSFLFFALSEGIIRLLLLFNTIFIVLALLLSRGHYSIDILSGLIFTFAIYQFGEIYLKDKLVIKWKK